VGADHEGREKGVKNKKGVKNLALSGFCLKIVLKHKESSEKRGLEGPAEQVKKGRKRSFPGTQKKQDFTSATKSNAPG